MITTTIPTLPTPPSSTDASNFRTRADDFLPKLDPFGQAINAVSSELNTTEANINAQALNASNSANSAAQSELNAQASANFKGVWNSTTSYAIGQSVLVDGYGFFVCLLANTNQNPTTTTGYWKINVPLGAIGNINNPLLFMPLKNSLALRAGVGSATFTRASTATYIDRYGVLKTAAIDEPRFEKEGYLNEGASTNLCANSSIPNTSQTAWSMSATYASISTTDFITAPDGVTQTPAIIQIGAAAGYIRARGIVSTASTTFTGSIFVKAGTCSTVTISARGGDDTNYQGFTLDLVTGIVTYKTSLIIGSPVVSLANGWFRCQVSTISSVSTTDYEYVDVRPAGTIVYGSTFYVFGGQVETLPFATSYIPTTSATVTRSADVLNVTRAGNFPNAQSNSDGITVACDIDSIGQNSATSQYIWSLYTTSTDTISASILGNSAIIQTMINNTGSTTNSYATLNFKKRRITTVASNLNLKLYADGIQGDSDTNTTGRLTDTANSLTSIRVGGLGSTTPSNFNGHITSFRIFDKELTAQEVALS